MVVTLEALGAWRTGLATSKHTKRRVFSLDLKDTSELAAITEFHREFLVVGAVKQKAHPEKVVLCNCTDSSRTEAECKHVPTDISTQVCVVGCNNQYAMHTIALHSTFFITATHSCLATSVGALCAPLQFCCCLYHYTRLFSWAELSADSCQLAGIF